MKIKETQIARSVRLHDVEIEMHSGQKFTYSISSKVRSWLEEWVGAGPFDPVPAADCFLCFGASPGRTVFVRMLDIRQVTVGPHQHTGAEGSNGHAIAVSRSPQPSATVVLRKSDTAIVFSHLDPADNMIEINEVNLWQPFFFKSGFLHFKEETGASRYVPVTSISVMDVDRALVCPQDPWMEK